MATDGLPIYYKNSKLVGPQSTKKKWKEYYLLVCTVVGFVILIAGVLWFVPSIEEDKSYSRAYSSFTGPSLLGVTDTSQEPKINARPDRPSPLPGDNVLRRSVDVGHEIDPRQRKLEEERREPIPVPGRGRPNTIEGRAAPQQEQRQEVAAREREDGEERIDDGGGVEQEGEREAGDGGQREEGEEVGREAAQVEDGGQREEEDPITKERREKIIEVCV